MIHKKLKHRESGTEPVCENRKEFTITGGEGIKYTCSSEVNHFLSEYFFLKILYWIESIFFMLCTCLNDKVEQIESELWKCIEYNDFMHW